MGTAPGVPSESMATHEDMGRLTQKTKRKKKAGINPVFFIMPVDPVTCHIHILALPQEVDLRLQYRHMSMVSTGLYTSMLV